MRHRTVDYGRRGALLVDGSKFLCEIYAALARHLKIHDRDIVAGTRPGRHERRSGAFEDRGRHLPALGISLKNEAVGCIVIDNE